MTSPGLQAPTERHPLSWSQQDFWYLQHSAPQNAAYNAAFCARIASPLDLDLFRRAWQTLACRHEILRARFPLLDGSPVQVSPDFAADDDGTDIVVIEARRWSQDRLQAAVTQSNEAPFDLENGPLWRIRLFALDSEQFVLLFSFHHILLDFWSVTVLLDEFGLIYSGLRDGVTPSLPPAFPFANYNTWQNGHLGTPAGERMANYWKAQVAKASESDVLQLPADRPLPPVRTFHGDMLSADLPVEVVTHLQQIARDANSTLFAALLAAFQTLLYRYTAQEKILVGVPFSGRRRAQFDRTVGPVANQTFVLTETATNLSFRELLTSVQQDFMAAMLYQEYPYRLMVQQTDRNGDRSRPPLAQVIFNMPLATHMGHLAPFFVPHPEVDPGDQPTIDLGGLKLHPFFIKQQAGQFFLMIEVWGHGNEYTLLWRYNTDIFERGTIERMAGCYRTLLEGIVADPDRAISRLPVLTEAEQRQMLETWNDVRCPVPTDKCIHQLFEEQVERTPDAVALVSPLEEKRLTYRELNARANQLAHFLQSLGVGPDVLVGICVERSLDMIVGLMGVLKAGGAYVPMDPNYPTERLGFMIEDAQTPILLTQEKCLAVLPEHNARVICLDRDWPTIAPNPATNPVSAVGPQHRVYCIFTSGSTGKPKGAQITHQNFVNNLFAYIEAYQVQDTVTSTLQMASFSFDMFGADLQRTLWHGAKLVICPQEWLLDPERLYGLMRSEAVDFAQFVPAVLRALADYVEKSGLDLGFLRILNIGGDVWYMHEFERFKRLCSPTARIVNSYGVTECTIDSSYFEHTEAQVALEGIVPIGRPFANTRLYILDQHRQPLPIGVVGDLYIAGANVGLGYLNRPQLNQERFVPDPWSPDGATMYKTGDLARYLPDGNIDFLGRSDHQVKIRGFRVELGEIETLLGQHPDVREAVILAQDQGAGRRLVAYVVPRFGGLDLNVLRAWLADQLPEYMVPSAFVYMDALPLTPNGKVNRGNLPQPDGDHLARSTPYRRPSTAAEAQLAEIWQEALQVEQVGVDDNFFELGGDSILAIQIISRARQAGLHFSVRELFQARNIAQLTAAATGETPAPQTPTAQTPSTPPAAADVYPLAPMQAEMLAHLTAEPDSRAYWLQFSCTLQGPLDVDAFKSAWQQVADRHPALRTTFAHRDDEIVQVVSSRMELAWIEADWAAMSSTDQQKALGDFLREDEQKGAPTSGEALVRCALFRCEEDIHCFVVSLHHLLTDGWSFTVLLQEVMAFYDGAIHREQVQLGAPRPYHDYIHWLAQQNMPEAKSFWQKTLGGRHAPTRLTRSQEVTGPPSYAAQDRDLPRGLSARLQSLARSNNLTLNALIQGSVALLLRHASGDCDVVYGVTFSGRPPDLPGVDSMTGLLIHSLPLRVEVNEARSLLPWLADLLQTQAATEPYIYTPLTRIQTWCDHPQPLFQCNVRFQNFPRGEELRRHWGSSLQVHNAAMVDWWHYPLNVIVTPGATLNIAITHDERHIDSQRVSALLDGFERVLDSFAEEPQAILAQHLCVLE